MRQTATEKEKTCEQCNRPLFGRTDKRFCNDTCRNTFNRAKAEREKIKAHENLPEILRIIKRNYELLKAHGGIGQMKSDESCYFEKHELLKEGFNPKFYTSVREISGTLWYFCFERGWSIGDTYCFMIDVPEQAEI